MDMGDKYNGRENLYSPSKNLINIESKSTMIIKNIYNFKEAWCCVIVEWPSSNIDPETDPEQWHSYGK